MKSVTTRGLPTSPHLAGKAGDVGRAGADNRLCLNAVLWVARHGCPWRALPPHFGNCRRALELRQAVQQAGKVLADKAYDTSQVWAAVAALGAEAVLASQPRRRTARPVHTACYRQRNRIERLLSRFEQFRRLATRYDKTASSFLGFVPFVCAIFWLR